MTLSSLSSTRSPCLSTQETSTPASGHPGTTPPDTLRAPDSMPAPRRAASPGPSASIQLRTALRPAAMHEIRPPAGQARGTTGTGEPASQRHGFAMPLALAGDNYAVLHKEINRLDRGAEHARAQWMANGDGKDLAAAQTLKIQGAVLNGLYSFRVHHKDWLSQTPMVAPATMGHLLPLFRKALTLCKTESDAVQFPIDSSPLPELAHLQARARESLQSLVNGQWQATAEGAWYAERQGAMRTRQQGALPDPFAGLQEACRKLDEVLEQLQSTLIHGPAAGHIAAEAPAQASGPQGLPAQDEAGAPASSQAGPRSYKSVLSTDLPAAGSEGTLPRQPAPPLQPTTQRTDPATKPSTSVMSGSHEPHRTSHHRGSAHPQGSRRAVPNRAAPALPPTQTRPRHQAIQARSAAPPPLVLTLPASPPALRQAADSGPSSPTATASPLASPTAATVAVPPPVDPVAEAAAQLRQEQLDALKAALTPLQDKALSLSKAAERKVAKEEASRSNASGQPWDLHTREFRTWAGVVKAYGACTTKLKDELKKLKTEAGVSAVLDSGDPAVRSLQAAIDKASERARERVIQAADKTLAAFAQTCHTALVQEDLKGARVSSYKELGEHCRALDKAWQESDLRPDLPELEGRMKQYQAYDMVCGVREDVSNSHERILFKTEQLHEAATLSRRAFEGAPPALDNRLRAFHKTCSNRRSDILTAVVGGEVNAVFTTYDYQGARLKALREKSAEVATACDTLLIGNPLPQAQAREPGFPAAAVQSLQLALPEADRSLMDAASTVAAAVRKQREQAIVLPNHDVPQRALNEQLGGQAVLRQLELTAETTADVLERFHLLSETLGTTPPGAQPALVQEHADAMGQRAVDLRKALQTHYERSDAVSNRTLSDWTLGGLMERSQTLLRADLRLAQRMHMSLKAQERLLDERVSARQLCSELEQGRLLDLASCPEFNGQAHGAIAEVLEAGMKTAEQDLSKEKPKITPTIWQREKDQHDLTASAMQRQIDGERTLIQGQLLLALAAGASSPGLDNPGRLDPLLGHGAKVIELFDSLTETNKTLKELAASPEHKDRYLAQHAINEEVRRGLLVLKLKLGSLNSPPPGTAVGSGSQVDAPAARTSGTTPAAAETAKDNKSSRRQRHARHQ